MSSASNLPDSDCPTVEPRAGLRRHAGGPDFQQVCAHTSRRHIKDMPLLKKAWLVLGSGAVQQAMGEVKPGETPGSASIIRHHAAAIDDMPRADPPETEPGVGVARPFSRTVKDRPASVLHFFGELALNNDQAGTETVRVDSRYFGVSVEISATIAEIHNSLIALSVPEGRGKVLTRCTSVTLRFDKCDVVFTGELAAVDTEMNLIYVERLAICAQGNRPLRTSRALPELPIESRVSGPGFEYTGRLEDVTPDTLTIFLGGADQAKLAKSDDLRVSVYLPNYDDAGLTEIAPPSPTIKSIKPLLHDGSVRLHVDIDTDDDLLNDLLIWLGRRWL